MPENAQSGNEALVRVKQLVQGLTLNQRLLLAGGAVLVGGVLWIFVVLLGQPKYVTLYSGMRAEEAQNLVARLSAKDIPSQISPDGGTILVPQDKVDVSRVETAAAGLPRTARLGFELFDTPNWAGSDFTERVNYQRALEGELERTIATLAEVEAVRVHLVLPQDSLFSEQQHDAKAAVILKTRGGRLSEPNQEAVPQLVASAVDRLRPENVTVVDADSNMPMLRHRDTATGMDRGLDDTLARTLVRTLEPVVGPDHVRASVHVEYELGTSEDTVETYDPKTSAVLSQEHSEENSSGAAPAGVPGTTSNVPSGTPSPASTPGAEQSNSRTDATTYGVSKTLHHSVEPAGRVRRIAAAVLVDDVLETSDQGGKPVTSRRKRTPDEMKEIERLAQAAIGVDSQRGDVLAVENLSFQKTPVEVLPPPGRTEHWRQIVQPWSWALRYVGLAALFLVVYGLVLRPVKKQALAAFRNLPGRTAGKLTPAYSGANGASIADGEHGAEVGGNRTSHLKHLLTEKIKAEPESASRLVQGWVQQETQK